MLHAREGEVCLLDRRSTRGLLDPEALRVKRQRGVLGKTECARRVLQKGCDQRGINGRRKIAKGVEARVEKVKLRAPGRIAQPHLVELSGVGGLLGGTAHATHAAAEPAVATHVVKRTSTEKPGPGK